MLNIYMKTCIFLEIVTIILTLADFLTVDDFMEFTTFGLHSKQSSTFCIFEVLVYAET